MKRFAGLQCLAYGFLAIIAVLIGACGKNDTVTGPVRETPLGTISGKIRFEGTSNFSGITVTLEKMTGGVTAKVAAMQNPRAEKTVADSEMMQAVTDEKGEFSFERVPFGDYVLTAEQNRGNLAKTAHVTIASQEPVIVDIVLTATANIIGTVLLENLTDNSGIIVFIAGTSYMAITDQDGSYLISGVPLGSYVVQTSASEYDDGFAGVVLEKAGAETAAPVITLRKTGTIMGRVVHAASNNPLADVTVQTLSGQTAVTDVNGVFTVRSVPAGSALLSFTKTGYDTAWESVSPIQSGELTTLPKAVKMYPTGMTPPENTDEYNRGYASIFCKITSSGGVIEGDATVGRTTDLIAVYDFDYTLIQTGTAFSSGGTLTGKAQFGDISIIKHVDKSSPLLMKLCSIAQHLPKVEFFFYRIDSTGVQKQYYLITLEEVIISGVKTYNYNDFQPYQDMEQVSFNYTKITCKDVDTGIETGYNIATMQAFKSALAYREK
jgi:type VI secretion system secreted protein Hcp